VDRVMCLQHMWWQQVSNMSIRFVAGSILIADTSLR